MTVSLRVKRMASDRSVADPIFPEEGCPPEGEAIPEVRAPS